MIKSYRFLRQFVTAASKVMDSVPNVDISGDGKYKYILVNVIDPKSNQSKLIVRGFSDCQYHDNIFQKIKPTLEEKGLKAEVLGGGKIVFESDKKSINVFGESTAFGPADHQKSVSILEKIYPDFKVTNSGQ